MRENVKREDGKVVDNERVPIDPAHATVVACPSRRNSDRTPNLHFAIFNLKSPTPPGPRSCSVRLSPTAGEPPAPPITRTTSAPHTTADLPGVLSSAYCPAAGPECREEHERQECRHEVWEDLVINQATGQGEESADLQCQPHRQHPEQVLLRLDRPPRPVGLEQPTSSRRTKAVPQQADKSSTSGTIPARNGRETIRRFPRAHQRPQYINEK